MDDHRDIYTKPPAGGEQEPAKPVIEAVPADLRTRTIRVTGSVLVVMVLLLGGALIYTYQEESRYNDLRRKDRLAETEGATNRVELPEGVSGFPAPVVTLDSLTNFASVTGGVVAAAIAPQKMADAMGEVRIGAQYLVRSEWDNAELHARRALEIWPDMNVALRLLGAVYLYRGQSDQAIAALSRALQAEPFNPEILINLGTAHLQRRQYDKAEQYYTTALQLGTSSGSCHLNLGQLYVLWGRYELAVEHFEDALAAMPDNPTVLNNQAVAFIRLGRYEDGRKCLMRLIALRPQHPAPYFNVAMSYTLELQPQQALEWIRKGAALATPADCQRYLSDNDFSTLRGLPEFRALIQSLYPDLPQGPGGS